jgi:Putative zinc-finger
MARRRGVLMHDEYRLLAAASVDARLDPEGAALLKAHLATCTACQADHAAMIADHAWLSEPATPAWPRPEVRRFILEAARAPRIPATSDRRRSWTAVAATAAVVVLVGAVAVGAALRLQLGFGASSPGVPTAAQPGESGGLPTETTSTEPPQSPSATPTEVPLSASPVPRVGDHLSIWPAPATFPARQAFNLSHGFCFESTDKDPIASGRDPHTRVDYYIDGVLQVAERETLMPPDEACVVEVVSVLNVPSGLPPGVHHFTALWYIGTELDQTREADVRFE